MQDLKNPQTYYSDVASLLLITSSRMDTFPPAKHCPFLAPFSTLLTPTYISNHRQRITFLKKPSEPLQSDLDVPPLFSRYILGRRVIGASSPIPLTAPCANPLKAVTMIGSSLYPWHPALVPGPRQVDSTHIRYAMN